MRIGSKKKILNILQCILLILFFHCQAKAQKVKTIDGVKVILNGEKPKPPEGVQVKISLEEDLIVGTGDDPDESFSEVTSFVVDDEGNIFALDFKDHKIKVFDKSGKFLRFIGEKGQGPGEMDMPAGILITPENELVVEDATTKRLAFFTLEGKFIKNVSFADKMGMVNFIMDSNGNYFAREIGFADNKLLFEMKKYDRDLKLQFAIDKVEFPFPQPGIKINLMDMLTIYQFDQRGNILYGRNLDYEIKFFTPDGMHLRSIRKEYNQVKITPEDIEEILDRIPSMGPVNMKELFDFPKYFPPYQFFTLDEQGRLFVRTWEKGKNKDEYLIDIFDAEGRFISQFATKADIRLWKNQKMYAIEETEEGFKVIKQYSVS